MTRRLTRLLCALAAALLWHAGGLRAADVNGSVNGSALTPEKRDGLLSVAFRDTPIQDVFQMLARGERINIVLHKGVSGNVTVSLYDVPLSHAIRTIANAAGYGVEETRPGEFLIVERKVAPPPEPVRAKTLVRSYKVQYSSPKLVAEILAKHMSRDGKLTPLVERNMLVVEDLPEFHERIQGVLREIDVEPRQIMIEAKILEIQLDQSETFGVDWQKVFKADPANVVGTRGLAPRARPGFVFNFVNQNVELFLSALDSRGRVNTLATPKLMAMENQEAAVVIGERIGYKVTTTINLVTTESVQFLETGVILRVTPTVDDQGRIMMKIHPEVSSGSIQAGIPSKKSTEVTTQLLAEDGQSILIGGLIKNSTSVKKEGVPFLGTLPVVGWLFSNKEEAVASSETVVLITPRIVRSPADTMAHGEGNRLQRAERLFQEQANGLDNAPGLRQDPPSEPPGVPLPAPAPR